MLDYKLTILSCYKSVNKATHKIVSGHILFKLKVKKIISHRQPISVKRLQTFIFKERESNHSPPLSLIFS